MERPLVRLARYRADIIEAIDQRKWPIEWIERRIADGSIQTFENGAALIAVEKRIYPGGLVELHGLFAVGELQGVLELIDMAADAARIAGCDTFEVASRPAWSRLLKSRGFEPHQMSIVKELR